MEIDAQQGWWDAPAKDEWTCPECGQKSPTVDWLEGVVGCEDCGEHDGRMCPLCEEVFDHVWGSQLIAAASR